MPIDPSIPLGFRPAPTPNIADIKAKRLSLAHLMRQDEMGEMQMEQARQEVDEQKILREAYGQAQGNLERMKGLVAGKVSPKTMTGIENSILENRQNMLKLSAEELKLQNDRYKVLGDAGQSILMQPPEKRQAAWSQTRAMLAQRGIAELPEEYPGDEAVQLHTYAAMGAKEAAEYALKLKAETRSENAEVRAQQMHNAQLPGVEADTLVKQIGLEERTMPAIQDQQTWTAWREGLPKSLQARIPAIYSPAAVEAVGSMSMAKHEREAIRQRAEQMAQSDRFHADQVQLTKEGHAVSRENSIRSSADSRAIAGGAQAMNAEGKLRDDFRKDAGTFITVRDAYGRLSEAAQGDNGASDIALLFGFMKVMDPGSTVREGEFATAQNSGGIPDALRNSYNRALNGQRLTPHQRQNFLGEARKLYKRAEADHSKTKGQYRELATRYGVNPENVTLDYGTTVTDSVKMRAPDGTIRDVPLEKVTQAESLGAKRVP